MYQKLFGTDGVRGIANVELTPSIAYNLGKALALIYNVQIGKVKIVIGKDTRLSCDMLESAFASGAMAHGAEIELLGIVPSASVAYLAKQLKANAGVVISASHNNAEYNGIKIFNGNGYKITDLQEKQIEQIVTENKNLLVDNEFIGKITYNKKAIDIYEKYIKNSFETSFRESKICLDCANGAGYLIAPKIFEGLCRKLKVVFNKNDGNLINKNCGATSVENLSKFVKNGDFDIGFALDGDADRLIVLDELGNIVDGDGCLFLIAIYMKRKGLLKNNTVVGTVMSNYGLEVSLKEFGISLNRTSVGDKNVINEMLKGGFNLGGESSGHLIFLDKSTTSDAILTAIQILELLKEEKKPLSKLVSEMKKYPQLIVNIKVNKINKLKILQSDLLQEQIKLCEQQIFNKGRLVVRASGTENLIRIMVEGEDKILINKIALKLQQDIKKHNK